MGNTDLRSDRRLQAQVISFEVRFQDREDLVEKSSPPAPNLITHYFHMFESWVMRKSILLIGNNQDSTIKKITEVTILNISNFD
jgi:hypothetical protein